MKYFKHVTVFILFFAFTLQIASFWVMKAYFAINQENIERLYCVNKNAPELQCHGKCHLNKVLKNLDSSKTIDKTKVPVVFTFYFINAVFQFDVVKYCFTIAIKFNVLNLKLLSRSIGLEFPPS